MLDAKGGMAALSHVTTEQRDAMVDFFVAFDRGFKGCNRRATRTLGAERSPCG